MPRYFFHIAYNGTCYHGWQIQPDARSVQGEITSALTKLNGNDLVELVGCGRTDTGVHAAKYFFHADIDNISPEELKYKLNKMLAESISVKDVFIVPENLHARFDARWRTYRYFIHQKKDPFKENMSWYFTPELDLTEMNQAAKHLIGVQDFASFARLNSDVKTTMCEVKKAVWSQSDGQVLFEITANRFLRNMVRAIVGTCVDVGLKKLRSEEIVAIIRVKDRQEASVSAPACGLYLWDVEYDAY